MKRGSKKKMKDQKITKSISMSVGTLMKLKELEKQKHINISKYVEALIVDSFKGGAKDEK